MAITMNNNQATLTWLDSFKYTWYTCDQSAIPAFFSAVHSFFRGREVSKRDLDNYLKPQASTDSENIFTRAKQLITRNIQLFHPQTSPSGAVGFQNIGNSCFINTALKCILEAFGNDFINDRVNHHNEAKALLKEQLSNTDQNNENKQKEIQDKLNKLNEKDSLMTALGSLSHSYFKPNSFIETNSELRKFIDAIYDYGKNHENHFFNKIFSRNPTRKKKYQLLQNSSSEMILNLLSLITEESSKPSYVLTSITTIDYRLIAQPNTIEFSKSKVTAPAMITELHPQIVQGQTVQQGLHNSLQPNETDSKADDLLQEFEPFQIRKFLDIPQENCTYKILTTDHYSADLNKLTCLIANPAMEVNVGPRLMANLNENIVLPLTHHSEDGHGGTYINNQLYHVELQPQAIFLHHGGTNAGHKTALIREANGSFSEHNDDRISPPKETLSAFRRHPEGVIYKVIAVERAPEIDIPGENKKPNATLSIADNINQPDFRYNGRSH